MKIANRVFKTPFLQTKTKRSSFGQFYGGNNWKSLGLWSPVLSGVLFDTDKRPYVKEIEKKFRWTKPIPMAMWRCDDGLFFRLRCNFHWNQMISCGPISWICIWSNISFTLTPRLIDQVFLASFIWSISAASLCHQSSEEEN